MVETAPHTVPAMILGIVYLCVTFVGYWYVAEEKRALSYKWKRLLTIYNFFMAAFHFVQLVLFLQVFGADGSVTGIGSTNTNRGRFAVRMHAATRLVHFVDTFVTLYKADKDRIRKECLYHNSVILVLWGFVLDNKGLLDAGSIRFVGVVQCAIYTQAYTYLAASIWSNRLSCCLSMWVTFSQACMHCILLVFCIGACWYHFSNDGDAAAQSGFLLWGVHNLFMLVFVMAII